MENENKLGVMPISKLIWNMSLPIIASMLVQALYNIVDSVFVSRVSEQALTAVSLAFPAQNLMIGLATGTAVGVNALMGRALGAQMRERADRVANNGVFLAVVGFLISAVLGLTCADLFFRSQTQVENIIQMGNEYLRIVTIGSLGMFCQIMYERLLQGTGRSLLSMYTQGLGAIVNIVLDPVFIFVLDMGVAGAAVATIIGQFCGCALAIYFNHKKNTDITLSIKGFRPDWSLIGEIYAIGLPSVIMVGIGSVMTFLMNKILITYHSAHETAATAFGVYFKLNSFIFMPVFGMNNGIIPIVAYNYGAQNRRRMMETIKRGTLYASCIMVAGTSAEHLRRHRHHDGRGHPRPAHHLPELLHGRCVHRAGQLVPGTGQVTVLHGHVHRAAAGVSGAHRLRAGPLRRVRGQRRSGVVVLPHRRDRVPAADTVLLPACVQDHDRPDPRGAGVTKRDGRCRVRLFFCRSILYRWSERPAAGREDSLVCV